MDCPICQSPEVRRGSGTWNSHCLACGWVWDDPSLLPAIEVPDSVGEVVGYRAWNIAHTPEGPRLTSQTGAAVATVWRPGEVLSARCAQGHTHRSPDEGCTCGFYAARDRAHLISLPYHRMTAETVVGRVMMDGKVVPATLGYRGENVWPVEIRVPYQKWELARDLKDAYGAWGVDVQVDHTHQTRAWGEARPEGWCPTCGRKLVRGKCARHGDQTPIR